jgi:hypothetical protein
MCVGKTDAYVKTIMLENAHSKELVAIICIDFVQVLTMETFEYLGFLVQFSKGTSLSQAATFFANSDPDMPAAPVDVAEHSFFTVIFC